MKKFISLCLAIIAMVGLTGCSKNSVSSTNNRVVIYSCMEDFRNEYYGNRFKEEFPDYEISIQYLPTGNSAAKLKAEGDKTECDIIWALDSAYAESLKDNFMDISSFDSSKYLPDLVPDNNKYLPWERYSGAIIINRDALEQAGLELPTSYDDLLKPEYKGLISMPNPKASGTGYFYLLNMINVRGEEQAFDYFEKLTPNLLQYTSSGSGPVNALVQGEAAIGLGMTFQAINAINNGANIEVLFFEEGAPYSTAAFAVIEKENVKPETLEVFAFINDVLIYEDKELYSPEIIFNEQTISIPNYPLDMEYADMTNIYNVEYKEELLNKWAY